ncbi:MAG: hypothetical protein ACYC3Q_13640 [Gemmatimonadaceae bacterium]
MHRARLLIPVLLAALAGCSGPVRWDEPTAIDAPSAGATLALSGRHPTWSPPGAAPASLPAVIACPGSMRTARLLGNEWFATWFAVRADSSVVLEAARSTDGGATWPERAAVDTTDRGTQGCRRPPPALAADSASQYVHVAYWLTAPEGAGVFFSHTMPGHFMFHAPVPVMYGDRPSRTSVAASGMFVVVGYEDPNATDPEVWIALSRTQGHLFDERVSVAGGGAAPRVAVRGTTVAVAWERRNRQGEGAPAPATPGAGGTMVRTGEVTR